MSGSIPDIPRRYKIVTGNILRFARNKLRDAVVAAPNANDPSTSTFLPVLDRQKTYILQEDAPISQQLMAVSVPLRLVCCATPTGTLKKHVILCDVLNRRGFRA